MSHTNLNGNPKTRGTRTDGFSPSPTLLILILWLQLLALVTFFSNSFYLRILCIIKLHFLSLLHQVLCNSQIIIHVKSWRVFSRWQETLLKVKLDIHYVSLSPDSTLHKAKLSCSLIPFSCYSLHCPSDYGARFFSAFSIPLCPFVMEVTLLNTDFKVGMHSWFILELLRWSIHSWPI